MGSEVPLAAKVAFLRDPSHYPDRPARVEAIETHMAWVFLTERFAYKLKKPVRYPYLDFGTLAAREFYCREEVRLNQRLAPGVYLGVAALNRHDGRLVLNGDGEVVDWLVSMRRLPRARMVDRMIRHRALEGRQLASLAQRLVEFYRNCVPEPLSGEAYRRRCREAVLVNLQELQRLRAFCRDLDVQRLAELQLTFLERRACWFDARAGEARIVEGHGDLRPDHICFERPWPFIIDCLEFNRAFRVLDSADETAYLAMECAFLGYPEVGGEFLSLYDRYSGDELPPPLRWFYMTYRATLRGRLALARLRELPPDRMFHWYQRGRRYLTLAAGYARRLGVS